jgi:hypothetical protein
MLRCVLAATAAAMWMTAGPLVAQGGARIEYRVLATTKTSTLEKEMNDVAAAGFRFSAAMGGETALGGKEAVAVMSRPDGPHDRYEYKLLAANRTSTMEKELQQAAELGFDYRGQTVFESLFGGREVVCVLERNLDHRNSIPSSYRLQATSKTSTMQKELDAAGVDGYQVVGLTVGKTAVGGAELVAILKRADR